MPTPTNPRETAASWHETAPTRRELRDAAGTVLGFVTRSYCQWHAAVISVSAHSPTTYRNIGSFTDQPAARSAVEDALRVPPPAVERCHVVRFTARYQGSAPTDWLCATRLGETAGEVAAYLAEGNLQDHFALVGVYAFDLTPGALDVADVTVDVLHRVAALCEAEGTELPHTLADAFGVHGIPVPMAWGETEFRDHNDEHRLGAADCLPRRAA